MKGAAITKVREDAEMRQPEFAARLGIHSVTLSRYENDHDPIPLSIELALFELARRLGVDPPQAKPLKKSKNT